MSGRGRAFVTSTALIAVLVSLLAVAVVHTPASATPAPRDRVGNYTPAAGAKFNNPLGTQAQQRRLFRHLNRTIKSVPRKGTIRIAVFSFADPNTSQALIKAYQRGVRVKLIFAGNNVYPPMRQVQKVLGSDATKKSYAVFCSNSCRGTVGQMHAKYFSFSRAGKARYITMVGSNNLTKHNAKRQWSDLYTVTNNKTYFSAFKPWFAQLRKDTTVTSPYLEKTVGTHRIWITPVDLTATTDPLLTSLSSIRCEVPLGEIDPDSPTPDVVVPTRLRIATHAWNGDRGVVLARRVAELQGQGCAVQVFYYDIGSGSAVRSILTNAGVAMNPGATPGVHTHHKLLIISGAVDGQLSTTRVITGSQNWSTRALARDDIILQISDPATSAAYVAAFDRMWRIG